MEDLHGTKFSGMQNNNRIVEVKKSNWLGRDWFVRTNWKQGRDDDEQYDENYENGNHSDTNEQNQFSCDDARPAFTYVLKALWESSESV